LFPGLFIRFWVTAVGAIPRVMLPMFGVFVDSYWLAKMSEVTSFYSKGRKQKREFTGDSHDKDKRSTTEIQKYAKLILSPTFTTLENAYVDAIVRLGFTETDIPAANTQSVGGTAEMIRNWSVLKTMPATPTSPKTLRNLIAVEPEPTYSVNATASSAGATSRKFSGNQVISAEVNRSRSRHSQFDFEVDFQPWVPFANTHDSHPFEVCSFSP
jgi:hypothetical protein